MKILMRADINPNIGQGHVMRLLSVADALRDMGNSCAFILASDSRNDLIIARDYQVFILKTAYTQMDEEIDEVLHICSEYKANLLLVDSYYVTPGYLQTMKNHICTGYLDDVYSFAYPVDVLINYNIYADEKKYEAIFEKEGVKEPKMILGPSFAPLRKEFRDIPKRIQPEEVKKIAVSFGGADPLHMAKAFLEKLISDWEINSDDSVIRNSEIHMILGTMEPDLEEIKKIAEKNAWLKLHINVKEMKEILQMADLAVSAAGSTQYEICACRIPCICFSMADNQIPGGEEFGKRGIFHYAGDVRFDDCFYDTLISAVKILMKDYDLRCNMGMAEYELIDGNGAKRMAQAILEIANSETGRNPESEDKAETEMLLKKGGEGHE